MARHILQAKNISANSTGTPFQINANLPKGIWFWMFQHSGSGNNTIKPVVKRVANWLQDETDHELFTLDSTESIEYPGLVTTEMIGAAAGFKYKQTFEVPASQGQVQVDFEYGGGGTRTFIVDLWIEG